VWVAFAATSLLSSCALFQTRTHVEQGELYATGDPSYDEFFAAVHSFHEDANQAKGATEKGRAPIARALRISETSDAEAEIDAAKNGAKKLRDKSVLLHLQLTPETKLISTRGGGSVDADSDALMKAIEESARTLLELSQRLGTSSDKASELGKKRESLLERARTELHALPPVKREEIARELDASKRVLADDAETIALYAGASSKFVLDLARAVETGAPASPAPPPAPDPVKPAKPGPRFPAQKAGAAAASRFTAPRGVPAPRPAPAGATAPKPAAAPAKKKGGDDFDP
jgi:hypothetical protein